MAGSSMCQAWIGQYLRGSHGEVSSPHMKEGGLDVQSNKVNNGHQLCRFWEEMPQSLSWLLAEVGRQEAWKTNLRNPRAATSPAPHATATRVTYEAVCLPDPHKNIRLHSGMHPGHPHPIPFSTVQAPQPKLRVPRTLHPGWYLGR